MALLAPIAEQNFEKARDQIAQILLDEFAVNSIVPTIFTERIKPMDKTSLPAVNVVFSNAENAGDLDNADNTYRYMYNIDIFSNGTTSVGTTAGSSATIDLHKMVGIIKQVLQNQVYKNLLFGTAVPTVETRSIQSIQIAEPSEKADANSSVMARLVFMVRLSDNMELGASIPATKSTTKVTFQGNDAGYLWETE